MRNKLLLIIIGALAVMALVAPSAAFADGCPHGQTGTPPYCAPLPPNNFTIGRIKHGNRYVEVRVKLPGAGTLAAHGRQLKNAKITVNAAGTYTLKLELNCKGRQALRQSKDHKLKIKVTFTFTPVGGEPRTKTRLITFTFEELELGPITYGNRWVEVTVKTPGTGTLDASSARIKGDKFYVKTSGSYTSKLELNRKGQQALAKSKNHKLKVDVLFTFFPPGDGYPSTTTKTFTFTSTS
jgi:hypothetical protein